MNPSAMRWDKTKSDLTASRTRLYDLSHFAPICTARAKSCGHLSPRPRSPWSWLAPRILSAGDAAARRTNGSSLSHAAGLAPGKCDARIGLPPELSLDGVVKPLRRVWQQLRPARLLQRVDKSLEPCCARARRGMVECVLREEWVCGAHL